MLNLRYNADIRTLLAVALYFIVLSISFILPWGNWWQITGLVIANCFMSFVCAVIIHNTIHCPMFKSKTANKIMQIVLSLTWGHPISAFVPGHNFSHHMHTNTEKDTINTNKLRFKINFFNQLLFAVMVIPDILASETKFIAKIKDKQTAWLKQYYLEFAIFLIASAALLIYDWQKFLLFFMLPHLYAVWGLVSVNFFQHDGTIESDPYNHSRNFVSRGFNALFFNNGFHGMHHMRPELHWSLLPEYHDKYLKPYNHPNLNQANLFSYLIKTCIWPAKRIDYLGNPLKLTPKHKEEHLWLNDLDLSKNKLHLGAVDN